MGRIMSSGCPRNDRITRDEVLRKARPNYQNQPPNAYFENDYAIEILNRGSYMSAHVLLNLFNDLRKRDKMQGLPSILSLFRNEFNKFNNTRARMLDSIYHMRSKLF